MLWKGNKYEQIALKHLKKNKLQLIEQNFHSRHGEIDLIMQDQNDLVFVEVRYRSSDKYGSALESITHTKQNKIIKCALYYLNRTANSDINCRFDVVAISPKTEQTNKEHIHIEWIKSAFTGQT